jgi:cytochrome c peroxidase
MKAKFTIMLAALLSVAMVVNDQLIPMDQNASLTPMEELGKQLFFDKISDPGNMSCASCHGPKVGFTGPQSGVNKKGAVYKGAVSKRFGNRKPPSAAYATFSPIFHYDESEGLFVGGNFWDGRATGERLGNPAADQALGPFLNPVEQNMASKMAVLEVIASSSYAGLWEAVWGQPVSYSTPEDIEANYDRIGLAVAAYEASEEVNSFTSKFDYYLQGLVELTDLELEGMMLFNGEAQCNLCHTSEFSPSGDPPLFTDFTYDNIGVPRNPDNPFYDMDEVFLPDGSAINPEGEAWIDRGLGGFLATRPEYEALADDNMGKHKVPTLRNVDKRNGNGFTKAYMHNGVFKSLKEVVHFYNTRDVEDWPEPEVAENVNTDELGDLGLTDAQEDAVVAFLATLSDGWDLAAETARQALSPEYDWSLNIWPNPGSSRLFIDYEMRESATVILEIFSISGTKLQTIESCWLPEGSYRTEYNVSGLASGIYLVRLRAGNQTFVRKVMVSH